ncbi:MAG: selenocysteine-specific translation elongation factor [Candidatus Thorarchaeota archaeon]|nr:selenocysteine-specific translation elongation factor [Candidatus Thorarchaeota archaeon]
MDALVPIHIGLMGHIDHGKTALARALSERVSTAGLDKHPQAIQRGITIDLGFTMFILDKYLVTLVDSPGHADLIQSVVAGANIIDSAILVVAADEGPKIQTGEHLIVLRSMGITSIVVVISKIDLVTEKQVQDVENRMRSIVRDVGIQTVEYVHLSANEKKGIDELRDAILRIITPRERVTKGTLLMPIDHAFPVKGHGTVVTGTILRGHLSINDQVELVPSGARGRVRSIQTFSENRALVQAGDRVGINVPEFIPSEITRGDYICAPGTISSSDKVIVQIRINPLYRGRITKRMTVNAAIGMPISTAQIFPFIEQDSLRVIVDAVDTEDFKAALVLQRPVAIDKDAKILLLRTDLPPTQMRVIGSGSIIEIPHDVTLNKKKLRIGRVQRIRDEDVLVEGLASTKKVAEALINARVQSSGGAEGIVKSPFGTRGVVSVIFSTPVRESEDIYYERFIEEEYRFGQ